MRNISHYRIIRELGAGGMGEVYLAEDSRLGRNVAIKLLPTRFARDEERLRRFEQEARAASALNHPGIVTIHDVGEVDGQPFIVTELVDGETLRERITRSRPALVDSVGIAIQIADAIAAAHEAGIVHRDIKPENVMLRRDGFVKVLDFGLAKLAGSPAKTARGESPGLPTPETEPGRVMGTVSYMSPEQARGVTVGAPTDVFSLAVVLYELVSGRLPFAGETRTDVILAIVGKEPVPLSSLLPAVPPELDAIVAKALSKDAAARFSTAKELADELRRVEQLLESNAELATELRSDTPRSPSTEPTTKARSPRRRVLTTTVAILALAVGASTYLARRGGGEAIDSIAVLPFESANGDERAAYLSQGITENLINSFSRMQGVKVMSLNAVSRFSPATRGAPLDARAVGEALDVQAILTGRVSVQGDRFSIGVELVDARDERQLWGERFDLASSDILAMQEEIARRTLDRLRLTPGGGTVARPIKRHTQDTDAWERYIRGRYHLNKRSADAIRKGRDFFQQAIDEDPAYALAYAGISDSYALLTAQGAMASREAYPAALAAARKAIELDPSLAEGHASLAHAALHTGDVALAEKEFRRAIELEPDYVPAYQWQAELFAEKGRMDDAFAAVRKALEIDPLDLASNAFMAALFIRAGAHDEAIAQLKKTLEIDPGYFLAHLHLGTVYLETGRYGDAITEFGEGARLTDGHRGLSGLAVAYVKSGEPAKARTVADEIEERAGSQYVAPLDAARVYAALGDTEGALRWLAKAVDENSASKGRIRQADDFAFLRADPRFEELTGPAN